MNAQMFVGLLGALHRDEEGAAVVEYGIIAAGLAIPAIVGLAAIILVVSNVLSATMNGLFAYMTH
ncbi:MAG: Flp family type IVb pilin [Candidatus Eremiobacteraeota bacterium]|nr:Flp family type IVb pilin [Candidatus Eremiobacteraeota bacterium]